MSGIPPTPTTSIFEVFGQVDEILSLLNILVARSPTYAQFSAILKTNAQNIAAIQQELASTNNQINAVLVLLEAIIQGGATLANQGQIIQLLQNIRQSLQPNAPRSVGLDLENVEIVSQSTPSKPGP